MVLNSYRARVGVSISPRTPDISGFPNRTSIAGNRGRESPVWVPVTAKGPEFFMHKVKYRLNDPKLAPRRTRLEIPGWAGDRAPRTDGSHEQVWHCVPFSEGAQYGIELFYPYDN